MTLREFYRLISKFVTFSHLNDSGDRVKVKVANSILETDYIKVIMKDATYDITHFSQLPKGSLFKHHFLLLEMVDSDFCLTADYVGSGEVHVSVSDSKERILAGRLNAKTKKQLRMRTNILRTLEYCDRFTAINFGTLCHNCRHFISYMLDHIG